MKSQVGGKESVSPVLRAYRLSTPLAVGIYNMTCTAQHRRKGNRLLRVRVVSPIVCSPTSNMSVLLRFICESFKLNCSKVLLSGYVQT